MQCLQAVPVRCYCPNGSHQVAVAWQRPLDGRRLVSQRLRGGASKTSDASRCAGDFFQHAHPSRTMTTPWYSSDSRSTTGFLFQSFAVRCAAVPAIAPHGTSPLRGRSVDVRAGAEARGMARIPATQDQNGPTPLVRRAAGHWLPRRGPRRRPPPPPPPPQTYRTQQHVQSENASDTTSRSQLSLMKFQGSVKSEPRRSRPSRPHRRSRSRRRRPPRRIVGRPSSSSSPGCVSRAVAVAVRAVVAVVSVRAVVGIVVRAVIGVIAAIAAVVIAAAVVGVRASSSPSFSPSSE